MAANALSRDPYASLAYNPHSLSRRWGLFFSAHLIAGLPASLPLNHQTRALRHRMIRNIHADLKESDILQILVRSTWHDGLPAFTPPECAPVILKDGISKIDDLAAETGIDVLTLSILSDVPLHRPRNLELEDLVAQWRWLRLVWSHFSAPTGILPINGYHLPADPEAIHAHERDMLTHIIGQIGQFRHNIALAELRKLFQILKKSPANRQNPLQLCFLELLRLFCPYIGHELLYRYGAIKSPDQTES
ncbi:hypothetical protein [Thalassospira marina]|nr:hypothetical protein [Thalassospira marina]